MAHNLVYYKKNGSLTAILNDVHSQMTKYLQVKGQEDQAKEIETILRQVKLTAESMSNRSGSKIIDNVNDTLIELINKTFEEQSQQHTSLKKGSAGALFRRTHNQKANLIAGADDIFEEQLAFLLKAAADISEQNDSISVDMILGGQNVGLTGAINAMTNQISKKMTKITTQAAQNYKKSAEAASRLGGRAKVRAGKIDIKAPGFIVQADADDIISKLLRVFSGKTFSLKNYSSFKEKEGDNILHKTSNQINIHFGDSNVYKGITASLGSVYPDVEIQNAIYYRGMNYLRKITNPPDTSSFNVVQEHFAHLRFIYEIRGQGLVDEKGNSQVADFIIWNDPASTNIAVRSTKALIRDAVKNYTNPFAPVTLSANYFD